jgi:imidazoleglycerol-phosphate dehydratase
MLTLFAKHGLFDLDGEGEGRRRRRLSPHGRGCRPRAGRGLQGGARRQDRHPRYGFFYLPMDESLARVVVDLGGRAAPRVRRQAPTMFVRDFNHRAREGILPRVQQCARRNLHVKLEYGEEPHHVAEAIFKAWPAPSTWRPRSIPAPRTCCPSTKGKIVGLIEAWKAGRDGVRAACDERERVPISGARIIRTRSAGTGLPVVWFQALGHGHSHPLDPARFSSCRMAVNSRVMVALNAKLPTPMPHRSRHPSWP